MRIQVVAMTLLLIVAACAATIDKTATIVGRLVAGPVCPVETEPPDPACAPTPVADATVVATDVDGTHYQVVSRSDGSFSLSLPASDFTITFTEVEGLMGTPQPVVVGVTDHQSLDLGVIVYDTGIR